jgi:hypothetical protein
MIPAPSFVLPPRVAVWLVESFVREGQSASIRGDLLEEFSRLVSKSGVAFARRWYWRQSLKTVAHLIGSGGGRTLWPIAGGVLGGCLLIRLLSWCSETVLHTVLYKYHLQSAAVVFWLNYGKLIEQILNPIFVGWAIALATKRREMITALALGVCITTINGVNLVLLLRGIHNARLGNSQLYWLALPLMVGTLLGPAMTVFGAGMALKIRSTLARQFPVPRSGV